jgi:Zn-dependent protease with chaperone function
MHNAIFYIVIVIIVFDFILERWLNYLNARKRNTPLPEELKGIYDENKYQKSIEYDIANSKFSFVTSSFNFVIILLMLFLGGFAWVDGIAGNYTSNPIFKALIFFATLGFASNILNTPFSIYNTFVIEERFGFNKTTVRTFVLDKLKGWLLSILLGGALAYIILWFYYQTTTMFWVYAWAISSGFMIFFAMFYSNLIVPLFNKQEPLEDGELKDAISKFANKVNFKLDNIYKINGSKRSTKANAYFTGLGTKKRIVLYDTLIKELTTNEIVAVLAHEIGHYKRKHTLQSILLSLLQTGLTFYLISIFLKIPALSQALGVEQPSFHIGIIAFGILYSPFSLIIGLIINIISRKNEYEADFYARQNIDAENLISSLKKLSNNNLSNLTPHPVYVFFHYSHPTLLDRINALRKN